MRIGSLMAWARGSFGSGFKDRFCRERGSNTGDRFVRIVFIWSWEDRLWRIVYWGSLSMDRKKREQRKSKGGLWIKRRSKDNPCLESDLPPSGPCSEEIFRAWASLALWWGSWCVSLILRSISSGVSFVNKKIGRSWFCFDYLFPRIVFLGSLCRVGFFSFSFSFSSFFKKRSEDTRIGLGGSLRKGRGSSE